MQVNITNLKDNTIKFDKNIQSFEESSFNMYQNIEEMRSLWRTKKTDSLFSLFEEERTLTKHLISNLKKLKNVYQFLIDSLEQYGKKIDVDLDLRDKVLESFDTYMKEENKIIDIYNTIDMSYFTNETNDLKKDKDTVLDSKNKINKLEDAFKNMFDRIEEVEIEVEHKLNAINVVPIKEINFNELEENVVNGEVGIKPEIKTLVENKVKYYIDEQASYFEEIKKDFVNLGFAYASTLNSKHIETIENDMITEYTKTTINHQNIMDYALQELDRIVTVERESVKASQSINVENLHE